MVGGEDEVIEAGLGIRLGFGFCVVDEKGRERR